MNILKGIVAELRERRLWPVALLLLAGLVAVPVVLSKSPANVPAPQAPAAGSSASVSHGVPVTLAGSPSQAHLKGKARNPFIQQNVGSTTTTKTTSTATITAGNTSTAGAGAGTTSTAGTGSGSGGGSSSTTTTTGGTSGGGTPSTPSSTSPSTPTAKPKTATDGLTDTQSYDVTLSMTNPNGGVDAIDALERLTPLPSNRQPLVVELGVQKGGHRVLFAVQPGTVVSGPGACTPGRIDCAFLSLSPNQSETLSTQNSSDVATFAVTAISTEDHSTAAAADKARRAVSTAGRDLLTNSSTLSLFQYEPSIGAVVDLRNLTVGGN